MNSKLTEEKQYVQHKKCSVFKSYTMIASKQANARSFNGLRLSNFMRSRLQNYREFDKCCHFENNDDIKNDLSGIKIHDIKVPLVNSVERKGQKHST